MVRQARKTRVATRRRRQPTTALVKRIVQQEIRQEAEVKQTYGHQTLIGHSTLQHGNIYACSPVMNLVQGDDSNQRTGNEVFLRHLLIKGLIGNSSTVAEARFRVMVIASRKAYAPTLAGSYANWAGIAETFVADGLFIPSGYTTPYNALVNYHNTDFRVLSDRKLVIRPNLSSSVKSVPFTKDIKIMKKVEYRSASAGALTGMNYYVAIMPYTPGGTTSTSVGFIDTEFTCTFQDS